MATKKIKTEEDFENIEVSFFQEYQNAVMASQLQDAHSAESAFMNAKVIFNELVKISEDEEKRNYQLVLRFIETVMHMVKSASYISEERFSKAIAELELTNQLCDAGIEIFNKLTEEQLDDLEFADDFDILSGLRFNFAFYKHLAIVTHGVTQKSLEASEGKYVNEVEVLRMAANEIKKFNVHDYFDYNDDEFQRNVVTGIGTMLNRFADSYERKAERILEKRKTIEFAKPINNKVFIIHGHDEGLLLELKEILIKSFKIEPVILKFASDKGKTVIEKLEDYGKECAFAIAIVTPDDLSVNKKTKVYQARPNVLYELGWFCGRYGRSRIRILKKKGTTLPSDLDGLVTIDFNERIEETYRKIENDLKESGVSATLTPLLTN